MKCALRYVLLTLLLAALPLRGYAGVLAELCGPLHAGGVADIQAVQAHERGGEHQHDADKGTGGHDGPSHGASVCSICASCCAGASLAPHAGMGVAFSLPASHRIPFFDRQVPGFVPDQPDRPPLPL